MKRSMIAAVIALPLVLPLSGCIISVDGDGVDSHYGDWRDREEKNRRYISRLKPDMSFSQITSKLGTPDFNESFQKDDTQIQVLFYRTQRRDGDGVTTKDECTPLILQDGSLIGWGDKAYSEI